MMHNFRSSALSVLSASVLMCSLGCDKQQSPNTSQPTKSPTPSAHKDDHTHAPGDSHSHDAKPADSDHSHGETTQLGEQTAGGFTISASRDGAVVAGKDVPIDVIVSGGSSKVVAVRFWIGAQDAKGSIKAKAQPEGKGWHSHAEIPSPLPTGSKLWVEVESENQQKTLASFDLKS